MLVAPFSSLDPVADRPRALEVRALRVPGAASRAPHRPERMLLAWLLAGVGILVCIPAARGGVALGATLPFWLVVAPLINLVWCGRAKIAASARQILRRTATAHTRRQQARWIPRPAPRNALSHAGRRDRRERSADRRSHAPTGHGS